MRDRFSEQAAAVIAFMTCVSLPVPGIRQTELLSRAQASSLNLRDAQGRARCVRIAGPVFWMIPTPAWFAGAGALPPADTLASSSVQSALTCKNRGTGDMMTQTGVAAGGPAATGINA